MRKAPHPCSSEQDDLSKSRIERDKRILIASARAQARVVARLRAQVASLRAELAARQARAGPSSVERGGLSVQVDGHANAEPRPARQRTARAGRVRSTNGLPRDWGTSTSSVTIVSPLQEPRASNSSELRPPELQRAGVAGGDWSGPPRRRPWSAQLVCRQRIHATPSSAGPPAVARACDVPRLQPLRRCRPLALGILPEQSTCLACKESVGMESRLLGVLGRLKSARSDVAQSVKAALGAQKCDFDLRLLDARHRASTREAALVSQLELVESSNKELRGQVGQLESLAKQLIQAAEIASEGLALEAKSRRVSKPPQFAGATTAGCAAELASVEASLRSNLSAARDCIDCQSRQMRRLQDQVDVLRAALSAVSDGIVQALMSELCLIDGPER